MEEAISESLGLEKEWIKQVLGEQGQHMAINYYPQCPQPDLTYGLPPHTDPNALTILLQHLQVTGLQVLNGGKWLAVNPHPNAFVINIGDQLQVIYLFILFNIKTQRYVTLRYVTADLVINVPSRSDEFNL